MEKTFSIIKPNAVQKNAIGAIVDRFEKSNIRIAAMKLTKLTKEKAEGFYAEHKERPFFGELCDYMTSGIVFMSVLEGDNAVLKNRDLMGATDPKKAAPGTIRADFADSISANAVHGSDSVENAQLEIAQFFPALNQ